MLADYSKANRCYIIIYLQKWLEEDCSVYDWEPYFQHVVKTLEGGTDEDTQKRINDLHRKVKGVASCDILKDDIITKARMM